jgi:hypothetical protein
MKLADLVREIGGYPIRLPKVVQVLEAADIVLADRGGRNCPDKLTVAEIKAITEKLS